MNLKTISPDLWNLLNVLMKKNFLSDFVLVGGTSLALRSGYRSSIDIDLFCHPSFDRDFIQGKLLENFPEMEITAINGAGIFSSIHGIKVDFVNHPQTWLSGFEVIESVRHVSFEDLAAMKVNAVLGRGSKKDFSDLLYLHEMGITLAESLALFTKKYSKSLLFSAIRSLNYFDETESEFDPFYLNGWTWTEVREKFSKIAQKLAP